MNPTDRPTDRLDESFVPRLVAFIGTDVIGAGEPPESSTDLLMTGLVDSLGVVMIVEWLERELATTIDPGDVVLEHFSSVDAMLAYLRAR
jgi:acyl carrier protein